MEEYLLDLSFFQSHSLNFDPIKPNHKVKLKLNFSSKYNFDIICIKGARKSCLKQGCPQILRQAYCQVLKPAQICWWTPLCTLQQLGNGFPHIFLDFSDIFQILLTLLWICERPYCVWSFPDAQHAH